VLRHSVFALRGEVFMQTGSNMAVRYSCFNLSGALEFLGDRQSVIDLLPALCKALGQDVPLISELLSNGKMGDAAARLHSLKGFVPVFAFPELVQEVARVEKLSRGNDPDELAQAYEALAPALRCLGSEAAHYFAQTS
jgi:hypothetical protein